MGQKAKRAGTKKSKVCDKPASKFYHPLTRGDTGRMVRRGKRLGEGWFEVKVPIYTCCLCEKECSGFGNNPAPLAELPKKCCDECNSNKVIKSRIEMLKP